MVAGSWLKGPNHIPSRMFHTLVKKDGRILEEIRLIGLAVEKAHKLGRARGWGSVTPDLLKTVSVSGSVQVSRQGSFFHVSESYFQI